MNGQDTGSAVPYPPSPGNVRAVLLEPSSAFRLQVVRLCAALLLFVLVYLLLVGVAVALAMGTCYVGFFLITKHPRLFTIMIGLGLIGMGFMVVAFLLKFLFARSTPDESTTIEVTESEEPLLTDFVRRIAAEAGAPIPKRIILGPEVNAAVFFESSLLSMILPVRKNLRIGLGIVNVMTLSEFKAVLGHEFGHFSQKSMRLGSYAYGANHIVYNMLFENSSFGELLNRWASVSNYFQFFAGITVWIVRGIQEVMKRIFAVVQKMNMALSREMEFHADAVAASVAGSRPFVSMLHRLTPADICFSTLMQIYRGWSPGTARPDNAFSQHRALLLDYAKSHEIPVEHDLPQASLLSRGPWIKFRISTGNQWASHPAAADRETRVNALGFEVEPSHQSAWSLFIDPASVQARMTALLFPDVPGEEPAKVIDRARFVAHHPLGTHSLRLSHPFEEYFLGGRVKPLDVEAVLGLVGEQPAGGVPEILGDAALRLPSEIQTLDAETTWLKELIAERIGESSFEFDGAKFDAEDAPGLLERLERELIEKQAELEKTDERLFRYFLERAGEESRTEELLRLMREYAALDARAREVDPLAAEIGEKVNFLSWVGPKDIAARKTVGELVECDRKLERAIREFLAVDRDRMMSDDIRAVFDVYLRSTRVYLTAASPGQPGTAEEEVEYECSQCRATVRPEMDICPSCGEKLHEEPAIPEEKKSYCMTCEAEVTEDEDVCPNCGRTLLQEPGDTVCASCGTLLAAGQVQCPSCGAAGDLNPAGGGGANAEPSPRAADVVAYDKNDLKILREAVIAAARVGPALGRLTLKRILDFQGTLAAPPGQKGE